MSVSCMLRTYIPKVQISLYFQRNSALQLLCTCIVVCVHVVSYTHQIHRHNRVHLEHCHSLELYHTRSVECTVHLSSGIHTALYGTETHGSERDHYINNNNTQKAAIVTLPLTTYPQWVEPHTFTSLEQIHAPITSLEWLNLPLLPFLPFHNLPS